MSTTKTETTDAKVQATAAGLSELREQRQELESQIGQAVRDGDDKTADQLQQDREATDRQIERLTIQLDALRERRPEAVREDAQAELDEIGEALPQLAKDYGVALDVFHHRCNELSDGAGEVQAVRQKLVGLAGRAGSLAGEYDLAPPEMPSVEGFTIQRVKDVIHNIRENSENGPTTPAQAFERRYRRAKINRNSTQEESA